jgi:hypothetical protein
MEAMEGNEARPILSDKYKSIIYTCASCWLSFPYHRRVRRGSQRPKR